MGQRVDEGRFADVGPAHHGQLEGRLGAGFRGPGRAGVGRQGGHGGVHQGVNSPLMDGADGENPGKTQFRKLAGPDVVPVIVHFIDRHQHLFAGAPQPRGDLGVQRHDAFLHVDDQDDDMGGLDGQLDLLKGGAGDGVAGLFPMHQSDAARIHQREGLPVPFDLSRHAVARHARLVMHDGDAAAGDAVEKGRLSDVGAADNGD